MGRHSLEEESALFPPALLFSSLSDSLFALQILGTAFRSSPTNGASHGKGIVLEKVGVEAKQPNSAIRKCVRVQLVKNSKKITAFVPKCAAFFPLMQSWKTSKTDA